MFISAAIFAASTLCIGMQANPTEPQVRAWLAEECGRAERMDLPENLAIGWTYEDRCVLTAQELASLRSEVGDKPFHPRRPELEKVERQLRDGKTLTHLLLIRIGQDRWRFGMEYPGQLVMDTTYGSRESWQRMNDTLKVFDPSAVETGRTPDTNPKSQEFVFRPDLEAVFFGKFGSTKSSGLDLKNLTVDKLTWRATFASPDPSVLEWVYDGIWSLEHDRGFVESQIILKHPDAHWVGHVERFGDWKRLGDSGPWAAHTVRRLDAKNREWRRIVAVEQVGLTADELTAALAIPKAGVSDPIRGEPRIARVLDYRRGVDDRLDPDSGAISASHSLPGLPLKQPVDRSRVLGWGVLALLSAFAVALLTWRVRGYRATKEYC